MSQKQKTRQIEIPENLYSGLIDLFFSAVRSSNLMENDPELYNWVQYTIQNAFKNEDVLIVNNKIISKEDLNK